MDTPLKNILRSQIGALTGFSFEDFVRDLFLMRFGSESFTPMRHVRDKGCDGIFTDQRRIIACYGPTAYEKRDFEVKADGDFGLYREHWEENYENWGMVVNHSLSPDQPIKVEGLKARSTILGSEQLVFIIHDELCGAKRRKVARTLRVEEEYIATDFFKEILEDLLGSQQETGDEIPYERPMYIGEKITLNFDSSDVDAATNDYELSILGFQSLRNIIGSYEDSEITCIKHRIISDYQRYSGQFKERLSQMTEQYLAKYSGEEDDEYRHHIRTILLYHFEQCLIGKKTPSERGI